MKCSALFCALLLALCFYPFYQSESRTVLRPIKTEKMMAITGKVMCDASKRPVKTALATISVEGFNPIQAFTDVNGTFTASIPVATACKIAVRAAGFELQEEVIDFSSINQEGASGLVEIKLTPQVKLKLDGVVLSEKDRKPVDAELTIYRNSDFLKEDSKLVQNGQFSESLTNFGWYLIDLSAPGYVNVTDTIWVLNYKRKEMHKSYYLSPIEAGLTMRLKAVQFNFGKATITQDSYAEIDQMVEFMKKNPSLQVEVAGHTDSEGPDDYNLFLSQARAQAVVNYISSQGIGPEHLIAKGYGESKPIDSNATQSGKLKNRRVELVVVHK